MSNYGRDQIWDAETWADIDAAVLEEVRRVRVAQRVFPTYNLATPDGAAPSWVSSAAVENVDLNGVRLARLPEGEADPFLEISAGFQLTPAQAGAEKTLHAARTLAQMAAKSLGMAEDRLILHGTRSPVRRFGCQTNADALANRAGLSDLVVGGQEFVGVGAQDPQTLLAAVIAGIAQLAQDGWPSPYTLILGTDLYVEAMSRLSEASAETSLDRLKDTVAHVHVTGSLDPDRGILVSTAGSPISIYIGHDATTTCTGETLRGTGAVLEFKVVERIQYAVRDPRSIAVLGSGDPPTARAPRIP